jgi:PIN domain nuclease of toxin-antitoxin system
VSAEIAQLAGSFEDETPGDPADRIIIATALTLGAKLVTADERLRVSSQVVSVW